MTVLRSHFGFNIEHSIGSNALNHPVVIIPGHYLTLASGALYAGLRAYQKKQKKKELSQFLLDEKTSEAQDKVGSYGLVRTTLSKLGIKRLQFGETRRQQLAEVSAETEKPKKTPMEIQLNRRIAISGVSLTLATAGLLIWWPLTLLSIPGVVYLTFINCKEAYQTIKRGQVSVDTIVALTLVGCLVNGYLFIASLASFLSRLSRKLLLKVKNDSRKSLIDVFQQQPRRVWVLANGVEVDIPFENLQVGDITVVSAGESVPADGMIVAGVASIDQHILTGEAQPAEKEVGDTVFASTVVLSGKIQVEVERAGADTVVAEIAQILDQTADFKATTTLRAEALAEKTVVPTLALGVITWPILGPMTALAVINAHFKHKMTVVGAIIVVCK